MPSVRRGVRNEVPQRLKPALIDSAERGPEGPHYPSGAQRFSGLAATRIRRQVHVHKKRRRRGSALGFDRSYCLVVALCLASLTRVVSSSLVALATWSWSTSAGTVLFHSSRERS